MTYSCEELDGKDIVLSSRISKVDHEVLLPCQKHWETSEIFHERIHYMDVGETFEVKGYLEERCSSRYEFDGEDIQVSNDFDNTSTCLENILSPRLEYTYPFCGHEK